MRKNWSKYEIEKLEQLSKNNYSLEEMVEQLPDRTLNSVKLKLKKLGLTYRYTSNRSYWSESEKKQFTEDWYEQKYTIKGLCNKYNRSEGALKQQALRLGLGERRDYSALSTTQVMQGMGVCRSTVIKWINDGLKATKSRARREYLIDSDDLLKYLKEHQDNFNADMMDDDLFYSVPEWLHKKKIEDHQNYRVKSGTDKYTNSEKQMIISMFKSGKSNAEIAKRMNRTETAIKVLLPKLGYIRRYYNEYEIEILKEQASTHTIQELSELLPLRSERSIKEKCRELNIKINNNSNVIMRKSV